MQKPDVLPKKYKGYHLFNLVDDLETRANNRGAMLCNIYEEFSRADGTSSSHAMALIMGYFNEVPEDERDRVREFFIVHANDRGFAV